MATTVAARMQALIRASTHGDNAHAEVRAHPSGLVGFEVYEIRSPHVVLDSLLCRLLQQAADGRQCTVEAGDVTRILVRRRQRQGQEHEQGGEEGANSNNGDGLVNAVTRVIIGRGWLREAWLHLRYAPARRLLVQWAVAGAVCVVMPALLVGGGGGAYDYYGDDGHLGNSGGGGADAQSAKARTAAAVANLVYRAFLACAAVATLPAAVVLAIIGF